MKIYITILTSFFIFEVTASQIETEILNHFEKNYIYANREEKKKVSIISEKLNSSDFDTTKLNNLLKITKKIKGYENAKKAKPFLEGIDRSLLLFKNDISLFNSDKFIIISLFFSTINPKYFECLEDLFKTINFLNSNLIFDSNCKNKTKKIEKHLSNPLEITFASKKKEFLNILLNREINFIKFLDVLSFLSKKTDPETSNIQNYISLIAENGTPSYNETNKQKASEDFFDAIFCDDEAYIKAFPYLKEIFILFPNTTIDFRYFIGSYLLKNIHNNGANVLDVLLSIINEGWDPISFFSFLNTIVTHKSSENILHIINQMSSICPNFKKFSKNVLQYYVKYFSENQHYLQEFVNELNNNEDTALISGEIFLKKVVNFELSKKQRNDFDEEIDNSKNALSSSTNDQLAEKKKEYSELLTPKSLPNYHDLRQKRLARFDKKIL